MSVTLETHFVESKSTDPVERAIARKVIRILNDQTLDRQQRESLVKKRSVSCCAISSRCASASCWSRQRRKPNCPKAFEPSQCRCRTDKCISVQATRSPDLYGSRSGRRRKA